MSGKAKHSLTPQGVNAVKRAYEAIPKKNGRRVRGEIRKLLQEFQISRTQLNWIVRVCANLHTPDNEKDNTL